MSDYDDDLNGEQRDGKEKFFEETAAEPHLFTVDDVDERIAVDDEDQAKSGTGAGIFAIVLSVLSLFFLPVLLGIAGIVVGIIARNMRAQALGNWAIGIGAVSLIMKAFFAPFI